MAIENADPDILTARRIVAACNRNGSEVWVEYLMDGAYDDGESVTIALMAIKIGRGLDALPVQIAEAA